MKLLSEKKNGFEETDLRHTQKKTPANRFFQLMSLLVSWHIDKLPSAFLNGVIDENLVIDVTEKQNLKQALILKRHTLVWGVFHPSLLEDFVAKGVYLKKC